MQLIKNVRLMMMFVLGCCLVLGFTVWAALAVLPRAHAAQAATAAPHIATVPMPATATSCPTAGTARPAVMKPLALGKDQNIVYIFNEVPPNTSIAFGHLKRYDVRTGQKTVIVTSGVAIQRAQVSADGQWILFLATPDARGDRKHSALFQLVRMDGKGLQTLYCSPASEQVTNAQWSADQKFIIFDTFNNKTQVSTTTLLNVKTGQLQAELRTNQGHNGSFSIVTWLDNTRVYVLKSPLNSPVETLFILDITKDNDLNGDDLQKVTDLVVLNTSWSLDSNFNATKLFLGECQLPENSRGQITDIFVAPATGGTEHRIYHSTKRCLNTLRAVAPTTLLFTDTTPGGSFGHAELWKIKADGTGAVRLFDNGGTHTVVELTTFTQFPWSNVSRNGMFYALEVHQVMGNLQQLLFGSLSGGKATIFASTVTGSVAVVGWTTM